MREHDAKVVQPLECLFIICSSTTCVFFKAFLVVLSVRMALMKSPAEKPKPGVTMAKGPEGSKRH